MWTQTWPLWWSVGAFVVATVALLAVGPKLARVADQLADATGLGEAMVGAVLLGASTSLSGITTSVVAAAEGLASLSVSNALGGIAAQTAFLAVADVFHRKANLEHAAADPNNMLQSSVLVVLLSLVLFVSLAPQWTLWAVHPGSLVLLLAYVMGLWLAHRARQRPMWIPTQTSATREDEPEDASTRPSAGRLWIGFAGFALALAVCGWVLARSGGSIAEHTGLSQTVVGGLFTAVATSLPELVTAIAAVRRGALTLAVGDIVGGNAFDVLFLVVADVAYRGGSIYHAVGRSELLLVSLGILLTGLLLMGLVQRQRHGIGNIGFESLLILIVYACGFVVVAFA